MHLEHRVRSTTSRQAAAISGMANYGMDESGLCDSGLGTSRSTKSGSDESRSCVSRAFPGVRISAVRAEWLVLGSVALASTGQLLIKLGLNRHVSVGGSLPLRGILPTLGGLLIYALGTLLWIEAVRKRDISYLYPLSAVNYTLVALGGMLFLGEAVSSARWAGIAVITLGVGLMMSSRDEASHADPDKTHTGKREADARPMCGTESDAMKVTS